MHRIPARVLSKSITETADGDLLIPVIGIPFKGITDDNRDLAGDYFHENTDLGPLSTVMAFFDHGMDKYYTEYEVYGALDKLGVDPLMWETYIKKLGDFNFGEEHIGIAQKGDITPEGVMYTIIVNRRHRYKEMLRQLAEEGHLDASSGAKTRRDSKSEPGKIDYWSVAEISLTPTPMNPKAAALVAKSLITLGAGMDAEKQVETTSATPITDALREVVATDKSAEVGASESIAELVKGLRDEIAAVRAENAVLKETVVQNDKAIQKAFEDLATDMKTAIPELGRLIAKSLTVEVREEVAKSKAELRLEKPAAKSVAKNANIANWPGSN